MIARSAGDQYPDAGAYLRRLRVFIVFATSLLAIVLISGCADRLATIATREPIEVTLSADGQTRQFTSATSNVREFLEEADIEASPTDIVDPPLFTPIEDGMFISITRVTESIELIEHTIPYQRRIVRNESMDAEDPPLIIQTGKQGLQEIAVRIVYHDGLEFSRQETNTTIVEQAQDEIVMIGVGAALGSVVFPGTIAFINGGNSILMRGSSAFPEQLNTGSDLDRRVFSLSPNGTRLLYTKATTDTDHFNSLWVIDTERDAEPRYLDVDNVLWADWNPDRLAPEQIAFTTGIPTELLPGWEANNDLWIGDIPERSNVRFRPEQLLEAYPATYGWWGGNYAWSPSGEYVAFGFADEIGIFDPAATDDDDSRHLLHTFTEYNTRADWVWVPSLSWSPDSKYIAFTRHSGEDPESDQFDTWVLDIETGLSSPFVKQSGIWSHPSWSPSIAGGVESDEANSKIVFLKATNPLESQQSSYTLWSMDRDGSNSLQLYPPAGENSRFPRIQDFMAWSPTGKDIVFVYDNNLFIYNLENEEAMQITQGNNPVSNPSWAPYGSGINLQELTSEPQPTPTLQPPGSGGNFPID